MPNSSSTSRKGELGFEPAFQHLLEDVLQCSNKFIQRLDQLAIFDFETVLWLFLGVFHDAEPDFHSLLDILHHPDDEFDALLGKHELKEDIMKLHSFLFLFKHKINPRLHEGEVFNCRRHFRREELIQSVRTNRHAHENAFSVALIQFLGNRKPKKFGDPSQSSKCVGSRGDSKISSKSQPQKPHKSKNASASSRKSEKHSSEPFQPLSDIRVTKKKQKKSSSSDSENSATQRLRQGSNTYSKEPKSTAKSPKQPKHVSSSDFGRKPSSAVTEELWIVLHKALGCSEEFIKRSEHVGVCSLKELVRVCLGKEFDHEPDLYRILVYFYELSDKIDPISGSHPLKQDFLKVFSFGLHVKHCIIPNRARDASFDCTKSILEHKWHTDFTRDHNKLSRLFKKALTKFVHKFSYLGLTIVKPAPVRVIQVVKKSPTANRVTSKPSNSSFTPKTFPTRTVESLSSSKTPTVTRASISKVPVSQSSSDSDTKASVHPRPSRGSSSNFKEPLLMKTGSRDPVSIKGELRESMSSSGHSLKPQKQPQAVVLHDNFANFAPKSADEQGVTKVNDNPMDTSSKSKADTKVLQQVQDHQSILMDKSKGVPDSGENSVISKDAISFQMKGMSNGKEKKGLRHVSKCTNPGLLNRHANVIKDPVQSNKAKLTSAKHDSKSQDSDVETDSDSRHLQVPPIESLLLLKHQGTPIVSDPTSMTSGHQIEKFSDVFDCTACTVIKSKDGNSRIDTSVMSIETKCKPVNVVTPSVIETCKLTNQEHHADSDVSSMSEDDLSDMWTPSKLHRATDHILLKSESFETHCIHPSPSDGQDPSPDAGEVFQMAEVDATAPCATFRRSFNSAFNVTEHALDLETAVSKQDEFKETASTKDPSNRSQVVSKMFHQACNHNHVLNGSFQDVSDQGEHSAAIENKTLLRLKSMSKIKDKRSLTHVDTCTNPGLLNRHANVIKDEIPSSEVNFDIPWKSSEPSEIPGFTMLQAKHSETLCDTVSPCDDHKTSSNAKEVSQLAEDEMTALSVPSSGSQSTLFKNEEDSSCHKSFELSCNVAASPTKERMIHFSSEDFNAIMCNSNVHGLPIPFKNESMFSQDQEPESLTLTRSMSNSKSKQMTALNEMTKSQLTQIGDHPSEKLLELNCKTPNSIKGEKEEVPRSSDKFLVPQQQPCTMSQTEIFAFQNSELFSSQEQTRVFQSLSLDTNETLPVSGTRELITEEISTNFQVIPSFSPISDFPWNSQEHLRNQDASVMSSDVSQTLSEGQLPSLEPKPPHVINVIPLDKQKNTSDVSNNVSILLESTEDSQEISLKKEECLIEPEDPKFNVLDPGECNPDKESFKDPQTQKEMVHPIWHPGEQTEKPEKPSTSETQLQDLADVSESELHTVAPNQTKFNPTQGQDLTKFHPDVKGDLPSSTPVFAHSNSEDTVQNWQPSL